MTDFVGCASLLVFPFVDLAKKLNSRQSQPSPPLSGLRRLFATLHQLKPLPVLTLMSPGRWAGQFRI
ncbi:MAG: hypothetical protein LBR11_03580 [Deltaproteobacteria bacterium]|nr:hypothetical protein [Deltaproteobacteria bacterium]